MQLFLALESGSIFESESIFLNEEEVFRQDIVLFVEAQAIDIFYFIDIVID